MQKFLFEETCRIEDPEWDGFVASCPDPHHEQTSSWGMLQSCNGWRCERIIARRGSQIFGGAQLLTKKYGPRCSVGSVRRGPLAAQNNPLLRKQLLDALGNLCRRRGLSYLSVVLPYTGHYYLNELDSAGFAVRPDALPAQCSMASTLVIDLSPSLDEIFAAVQPKVKAHIRQGLEQGLEIREAAQSDPEIFSRLMNSLSRRRGVEPTIETTAFLSGFWELFSARGQLRLFMSQYRGEPVSALLLIVMGSWARVWRADWSGKYSAVRPNELLHWEAIQWAKNNGVRYFDFNGFDTKAARALALGSTVPVQKLCSVSAFKLGFGGRVLLLQPEYCYFFNPLARGLFRCMEKLRFGAALLPQRVLNSLKPYPEGGS